MEKDNNQLAIPKGKVIARPERPHDYTSKRGIRYWWFPDWVRDLNGTMCRIKPVKDKNGDVYLYMLSKDGNLSYIQGSIQKEFIKWHEDNQIDWILLGVDPEEIIAGEWEYV